MRGPVVPGTVFYGRQTTSPEQKHTNSCRQTVCRHVDAKTELNWINFSRDVCLELISCSSLNKTPEKCVLKCENMLILKKKVSPQADLFCFSLFVRSGHATSMGCVLQQETPIPAVLASSVTQTPPNSPGLWTKVHTTRSGSHRLKGEQPFLPKQTQNHH